MRIQSACWLLAVSLVAMPIAAHAGGWQLSAQGGTSIPTGDFSDENKANALAGWQVGGAIDYLWSDLWAFGFDVSFSGNPHASQGETIDLGGGNTYTLDEDQFTTWQAGVHGKLQIPSGSPLKPYALLGVGVSKSKEEWTETFTIGGNSSTTSGEESTDMRFGGKLGVGMLWWVHNVWGIGAEGDFNYVNEDNAQTGMTSLTYVGFRGGVSFRIPGMGGE